MVNYSYPATEGTTAVFSCSRSGYELTGPQSAMCTRNGEWAPDPRQVQCQGMIITSIIIMMFQCIIYQIFCFNMQLLTVEDHQLV